MNVTNPVGGVNGITRGMGRGLGGGVVESSLSAAIRRKLLELSKQHGHAAVIAAARRVLA